MPVKKKIPFVKKLVSVKKPKPKTETVSNKKDVSVARRSKRTPELLRGFRDLLPEEQKYWEKIRDLASRFAESYSFQRIDLPILEQEDLFIRTVGKDTDVIEKEMYTFIDLGGERVALRPEATASVARAYINHGMLDRPQPVKLFYIGPMFRHDRPQAGRYRQFCQMGFESIGQVDPIVDAQLIVIGYHFFRELGLDITVHLNSIGTPETRKAYINELVRYFRSHRQKLSEDDKRRLNKNPLRLLDSKEEYMPDLLKEAPQILDWLDEESKTHFMQVLDYLDGSEIPYLLNQHLVRGLDYYTRTVFEFWLSNDEGDRAQNALGGGGRYDGLVELLGGREGTPGCGFAIGIDRVVGIMREKQLAGKEPVYQIFFAQLGEAARRQGLRLFEEFRREGVSVAEAFSRSALKAQLDYANKLGVSHTLILGQKEVLDGTIIIRDMESGAQEIVDSQKVIAIVKKKLGFSISA